MTGGEPLGPREALRLYLDHLAGPEGAKHHLRVMCEGKETPEAPFAFITERLADPSPVERAEAFTIIARCGWHSGIATNTGVEAWRRRDTASASQGGRQDAAGERWQAIGRIITGLDAADPQFRKLLRKTQVDAVVSHPSCPADTGFRVVEKRLAVLLPKT